MIDIPFEFSASKGRSELDIGIWLESNIPNPPLPDQQRWTIGYENGTSRCGIRFADEHDSIIFKLRWA